MSGNNWNKGTSKPKKAHVPKGKVNVKYADGGAPKNSGRMVGRPGNR